MAFFQTDNLWVNQLADGVAALVLDVRDRGVNVFSRQVLAEVETALDRITAGEFHLLIVRSGKEGSFLAGADLNEFSTLKSAEEARALSEAGQRLFDKLARLRMPTVAMISGACLGGGLEFALACDYRVVIDQPKTQLGLPEIQLGLIPGWGGTQRLPRVVGLERALLIILGGRRLNARETLQWGLADGLAEEGQDEPPDFLARPVKRPRTGLPLRTWRQRLLESTRLGRWLLFRGAQRLLRRRLPDDMPAPLEALQAVRVGVQQGMEAGLAYERDAIGRLVTTPACRNLVNLFLQREQAKKPQPDGQRNGPSRIRRVGVVGLGTMGAGIAQLAALKGCEVVVREVNDAALGMGLIRVLALFRQAVERGIISPEDYEKRLAAIHGTTAWKGFDGVELVIEAIVEDLEAKRRLFRELERRTAPSTILATNTSSLRVEQLQEGLDHPGRVAGLHFFNPVHKMPLVEVVRAPQTRDGVVNRLAAWAADLDKTPVAVKDSPGFLVNRILMPYLNEAVLLLGEGMRTELVDEAMRRFGMPLGPLELLDQVGLDVAAHIARAMQSVFGQRFAISPAFEQMQGRGWLGQKSKQGFYRYRRSRKKVHRAAVDLIRRESQAAAPYQMEGLPPDEQTSEARARLVGLMVNEAAACLGEGIVDSAATLDLAMVLGAGWAPHRGGPMRYAQDQGIGTIVQSLEELARRLGPRFEPCAELRRRAEAAKPV